MTIYAEEDVMRSGPVARALSDAEQTNILSIKLAGREFHDRVASMGSSRELSLAKTKIEEAVMWAVKHIDR